MPTKLTAVVIEALDVPRLTAFWTAALDGREAGVELEFTPSTRPKTSKNRLHLDLASGPDQAASVSRLLDLGASRQDIGQGDVPWEVLADPEGNEFCVLPRPDISYGLLQICLDAGDPDIQGMFWIAATGWAITSRGDWGVCLRSPDDGGTGASLVMGPPVAVKPSPNRLMMSLAPQGPDPDAAVEVSRLLDAGASSGDGVLLDPEGNEFRVVGM